MIVRLGIPSSFGRFCGAALEVGAPVMVSANAFWKNDGRGFRLRDRSLFAGADVALDSAGFVAMKLYRGYRWSVRDYVRFAGRLDPTWWAAPDFCCEPETAIAALAGHPRVASVDSMAWDYAARAERRVGRTNDFRAGHLARWYQAQRDHLGLFA